MRNMGKRSVLLLAAALAIGCTEQPVEPTSTSTPKTAPADKKSIPRIDAESKARYFGGHQDLRERIRQAHENAATAGTKRATRTRNLQLLAHVPLEGLNGDVWAHKGFAYVGTWVIGGPPDFSFCPDLLQSESSRALCCGSTAQSMILSAEPAPPK